MRNSAFYLLALIVFSFFVFVIIKNENRFELDKGLTYEPIDRKEAIVGTQYNDLIVLQNEGENNYHVFRVIDLTPLFYEQGGALVLHFRTEADDDRNPSDLFNAAYHNQLLFKDTLLVKAGVLLKSVYHNKVLFKDTVEIELIDGIALVENASFFEGRRYHHPKFGSTDMFTQIEDSALVFILLSVGGLFILLFIDFLLFIFKAAKYSKKYYTIHILCILLAVVFFFNMVNPTGYASYSFIHLLFWVLLFGGIYFIYQLDTGRLKGWTNSRVKEETYKFLLMYGTSIVLIFLVNGICLFIDQNILSSRGYNVLGAHGRMHLEFAFAFSFALGNTHHNMLKYVWSLRRQNKRLKNNEGKVLASEAELNAIQASVNPHFLYNSLNSIASLATVDPQKTEEMALALSEFYKYNTNRSEDPLSSIADEVDMLETYLGIEKIRFGDRLNYTIEVDPNVKEVEIPHFLLQPIMENAIKYGFDESNETINIQLIIKQEKGALLIQLFDTGKPFDENLSSGYGLKSVLKKLKLLYPNKHQIAFVNEPLKHVSININDN